MDPHHEIVMHAVKMTIVNIPQQARSVQGTGVEIEAYQGVSLILIDGTANYAIDLVLHRMQIGRKNVVGLLRRYSLSRIDPRRARRRRVSITNRPNPSSVVIGVKE